MSPHGTQPHGPNACSALLAGIALASLVAGCGDEAPSQRGRAPETPPPPPPAAEAQSVRARPNLVLVTLDTTRTDALGAYGQSRPTSPTLDALAARGVLFEQVNTVSPETLPSHASIFTGMWPFSHGVRANAGHVLADRNITLAEILGLEGYETHAEVAAPVLGVETGITQGFDQVRTADTHGVKLKVIPLDGERRTFRARTGSDIATNGIEFLRRQHTVPFFLWLHFFDAHDPYAPPARFARMIPDSTYHAEVASADAELGRVIEEIDRLGLAERTLVVVTADHGEGLGDHREVTHSFFVYEATMRVPLVITGARGVAAGRRIADPVRSVDVVPTILELLDIAIPDEVEGASLARLIRGETARAKQGSYGEATRLNATFGLPTIRFYREGAWKYIHKVNPELYDLAADPGESTNLVDRHANVAARLRAGLSALLANTSSRVDATTPIEPEAAARLTALGYAARAPDADPDDPLALWGDDPFSKAEDARLLAEAAGLRDRGLWAEVQTRLEGVHRNNPDSAYVLEMYGQSLAGLNRRDEAIEIFQDLLARAPCNATGLNQLGKQLRASRRYADLVRMHATGVERCPDLFANLNNYAWVLATLPPDELRDGKRAVVLLEPAIEALDDVDPMVLDTLAAAQAEAGDFPAAIGTQARAIEQLRAAGDSAATVAILEAHLAEFRAGRAIREP